MSNFLDPFYNEHIRNNDYISLYNSRKYSSKELILAKTSFNLNENRWISLMYSKINPMSKKLSSYYTVTIDEFSKIYKLSRKTSYIYAKNLIKTKIKLKKINIPKSINDLKIGFIKINFINDVVLKTPELLFYLNEKDMSPHLLKKT